MNDEDNIILTYMILINRRQRGRRDLARRAVDRAL